MFSLAAALRAPFGAALFRQRAAMLFERLFPTMSSASYIAVAVNAARRAAAEISRAASDIDLVQVENKAVNDFVTSADRASEEIIVRTLQQTYPKHAILTEEAGMIGSEKSPYLWIIDPIDGTLNFMHGIPQYAISIALAYKGEVVVGVIYDVAKNELFTAAKGEGAFLNQRRIRVSTNIDMNRAVIGTGFPFRRGSDFKGYMQSFLRVAERTAGIRRPGSAALDLAWVAAGRYDGFWEKGLKKWDCAAGGLMVLEAGGLITDLTGGENWLETGDICAGSPKIFAKLLPLVGTLAKPEAAEKKTLSTKPAAKAEKPAAE
jgi:myo-inositol-1(or 4)-monophosphatase